MMNKTRVHVMNKDNNTPKRWDPLGEKSIQFAIRIVNLSKYLKLQKDEYLMSKQILRAGTNPGAMIREAVNAESALDFIHKLSIAQKEVAETQYWLEILWKTEYISQTEFSSLNQDAEELMKLLKSSILTKKRKLQPR